MSKGGGTIYAIGAEGSPYVKIGSTTGKVRKRLGQLQVGHPLPLHIIASVAVEDNVNTIERRVHAFLAEQRRNGEWFDVPMNEEELAALVVRAIEYIAETGITNDAIPSATMIVLGERVHMLRRRKKMSQLALGGAIEASPTTMSNLERGKLMGIHLDHLMNLAEVLGVTMDYLVGRSDDETAPGEPRIEQGATPC